MAAPNFTVFYPLLRETVNPHKAFKQDLMGIHAGLPDVEVVIEDEITEGDKVAVRWMMRGTQTGELLGIPPTGKPVTLTGTNIYHLSDGKVIEEREEEDALSFLQQLGVVPPQGQTGKSPR